MYPPCNFICLNNLKVCFSLLQSMLAEQCEAYDGLRVCRLSPRFGREREREREFRDALRLTFPRVFSYRRHLPFSHALPLVSRLHHQGVSGILFLLVSLSLIIFSHPPLYLNIVLF